MKYHIYLCISRPFIFKPKIGFFFISGKGEIQIDRISPRVSYFWRCFEFTVDKKEKKDATVYFEVYWHLLSIVHTQTLQFSCQGISALSLKKGTLKMKASFTELTFHYVLLSKGALVDKRNIKELWKTARWKSHHLGKLCTQPTDLHLPGY